MLIKSRETSVRLARIKCRKAASKQTKGLWNFTKPLLTHKLTILTYDIFGARIIKDEYKLAKNLTSTT